MEEVFQTIVVQRYGMSVDFQVLSSRIPISVSIRCRKVVDEHPMMTSLVSMKK